MAKKEQLNNEEFQITTQPAIKRRAKKLITNILSDGGSVGKTTLAIGIKEMFNDQQKKTGIVNSAFFNLDDTNNKFMDLYAQIDETGQPLPREEQDPLVSVGFIDLATQSDKVIDTQDLDVDYIILDYPARGARSQVDTFGHAAKFVRSFRKSDLRYMIPLATYKDIQTIERIYDMVDSVDSKGYVDFVFVFQHGLIKQSFFEEFESNPKVNALKQKYPFTEVHIKTLFKDKFSNNLLKQKWFDSYYGEKLDRVSEMTMELLLKEYVTQIAPLYDLPDQFKEID